MPTRSFAARLPLIALAALTTLSACGGAEGEATPASNDPGDAGRRRRSDAAQPAADAAGSPSGADASPTDAEPEARDAASADAGPLADMSTSELTDATPDAAPTPDAVVPAECNGQTVNDLSAALAGTNTVLGTTAGTSPLLAASCGGAAGGEVVYAYDLAVPLDRLSISTVAEETTSPTVVYVRRGCDVANDLVCNRGSAMQPGTAVQLGPVDPGRLYIVVDQGARDGGGPFRLTVDAEPASACRNRVDDDLDGRVDLADPGCEVGDDDSEIDPGRPPQCADGIDNDNDMRVDYPGDPECLAAGIDREAPSCELDVPLTDLGEGGGNFMVQLDANRPSQVEPTCGFGTASEVLYQLRVTRPVSLRVSAGADFFGREGGPFALYVREVCDQGPDAGCVTGGFNGRLEVPMLDRGTYFIVVDVSNEWQNFGVPQFTANLDIQVTPLRPGCADELDNDFDGETDGADLGCASAVDDDESDDPAIRPFCADGRDNDGDGASDFPADDGCDALGDPCEEPGYALCGGVCRDINTDAANCGRCGVQCDPGVECINAYCGGAVAVFPNDAFGHHGSCDAWNSCGDAQGCADAACRVEGFARAVEFEVGSCQGLPAQGIRCNLFFGLPGLDYDADYRGCELPVAYNIRCLP